MVQAIDIGADVNATEGAWPFWRYVVIFLTGILFFVAFDLMDGSLLNGDTDDLMRAVQVRTLLETGDWFDMSIPSVQMPEIYRSPWSRLVDLPYILIAGGLTPLAGQERALWLAFHFWPPIMAIFYGLLVVATLKRLVPRQGDLPISVLLAVTIFSIYAICEFSPGRIDHHNVQILAMLAMVYGVGRWDARGGLIAGAAVSVAVAVGFETLPLIASFLVALVTTWGLGAKGSAHFLKATGAAVSVTAITLMALLIPPADYFTLRPDSFSTPYAAALVGFGVLAVVMPRLFPGQGRRITGGLAFACLGLAILLLIGWQYPELAAGPFPTLGGFARIYWFDRIQQEMSAALFFRVGDYKSIILVVLMLATLALALPAAWRAARAGQGTLPLIVTIAVAAAGLTLVSNRTLRLALAIVPLLLPFAIATVRDVMVAQRARPVRMALLGGAGAVAIAGFLSLFLIVPRGVPAFDAYDFLLMNDCRMADRSVLERLSTARVMAPPALGLQIIGDARKGISVSSIPFHRASPGMNGVLSTFRARTGQTRAAGLRHFDYLAICRSPSGLSAEDELPLFADLMSGRTVPGLDLVPGSDGLMVFRIDHAAIK